MFKRVKERKKKSWLKVKPYKYLPSQVYKKKLKYLDKNAI